MNALTPLAISFVPEVEQNALGALLHGGDFRKVASFLRSEHFISDIHRILFDTIAIAFDQYGSTSVPIVAKLLPPDSAMGFMAKTGETPVSYMTGLREQTLGAGQLERSARSVVQQWARMKASELGSRMSTAAADPAADASKIIKSMSSDLDLIASAMRAGPRRKTRVSLAEAAENAFTAAEEGRQRGSGLTGVTWGLSDVNRLTGGIQRRDLTLIAARPSMGKTTVGLSVAIKAARAGTAVGFISLEMDADKLGARAVSDIAFEWGVKVPYADMIRGSVNSQDIEAVRSASRDLDRIPLLIEDQPGLSMSDIRTKAEAMMEATERAGKSLGCLVVDHIGLILPSSRYQGSRVNEISEITAGLKGFAREYGIAVVALSQLNRALESRDDKRPQLSDLRDSGAIEQDADTIVFLYREAYYLEREKAKSADGDRTRIERLLECQNKLEFAIAKQRNGPVRTVDLFVDMACAAVCNGAR